MRVEYWRNACHAATVERYVRLKGVFLMMIGGGRRSAARYHGHGSKVVGHQRRRFYGEGDIRGSIGCIIVT